MQVWFMRCYSGKTSLFYTLFTQDRTLTGEITEIGWSTAGGTTCFVPQPERAFSTTTTDLRKTGCMLDWATETNQRGCSCWHLWEEIGWFCNMKLALGWAPVCLCSLRAANHPRHLLRRPQRFPSTGWEMMHLQDYKRRMLVAFGYRRQCSE